MTYWITKLSPTGGSITLPVRNEENHYKKMQVLQANFQNQEFQADFLSRQGLYKGAPGSLPEEVHGKLEKETSALLEKCKTA